MHGVLAPVLTPFRPDYSVDEPRLLAHCRWLLEQDVGLVLFGTTSEANSLSLDERLDLLERLAPLAPERILVGTGGCAFPDTVRLSARAVALGCAGVLVLPPFYYKGVSDEGLFRSYSEIIERVGDARLRIYLYHIPPVAQVGLSFALIERLLAAWPQTVVGIKDSSGDLAHTLALLKRFPLEVFAGSESALLATLQAGGRGCISATANVNPHALVQLFHEPTPARQAAVTAVREAFRPYPMIASLKAVLGWPTVRPPLVELGNAWPQLQEALEAAGFANSLE